MRKAWAIFLISPALAYAGTGIEVNSNPKALLKSTNTWVNPQVFLSSVTFNGIWFQDGSSVTSANFKSPFVLDEGILQGGATWFNFVGANVAATVTGGTATITITGGAGGGGGSNALYVEPAGVSVSTLFFPKNDFNATSGGGISTITIKNATGTWTAAQVVRSTWNFEYKVQIATDVVIFGSATIMGQVSSTGGYVGGPATFSWLNVAGVNFLTFTSTTQGQITVALAALSTTSLAIDFLKVFTSTVQADIDKYKAFSSTVQADIDKYKVFSSTVQTDIDKYKVFSSSVQDKLSNGAVSVYDEGSAQGNATTFNFVGAGVAATQSGSTTTVTIAGSAGGGGGSAALYIEPTQVSISTIFFPTSEFQATTGGGISTITVRNATGTWTAPQNFSTATIRLLAVGNISSATATGIKITTSDDPNVVVHLSSYGATFLLDNPGSASFTMGPSPTLRLMAHGDSNAGPVYQDTVAYFDHQIRTVSTTFDPKNAIYTFSDSNGRPIWAVDNFKHFAFFPSDNPDTYSNTLGQSFSVNSEISQGGVLYSVQRSSVDAKINLILTALSTGSTINDTQNSTITAIVQSTTTAGAAGGSINNADNPLSWTRLKDVPAGFADGTDDGSAGGGGSTGVFISTTASRFNQSFTTAVFLGDLVSSAAYVNGIASVTFTLDKADKFNNFTSSVQDILSALTIATSTLFSQEPADISDLTYYLHNETTGTGSVYRLLGSSPAIGAEVQRTAPVDNTMGMVRISSHVTAALQPGVRKLPAGVWDFVTFASIDSQVGNTYIVVTVSSFSQAGNAFEFLSSTLSELNATVPTRFEGAAVQQNDIVVSTMDRVLVQYFAKTDNALAVNPKIYYAGAVNYSHLNVPFGSIFKFTQLDDTPMSYSGQRNKYVAVNNDETDLVFVTSITDSFNAFAATAQAAIDNRLSNSFIAFSSNIRLDQGQLLRASHTISGLIGNLVQNGIASIDITTMTNALFTTMTWTAAQNFSSATFNSSVTINQSLIVNSSFTVEGGSITFGDTTIVISCPMAQGQHLVVTKTNGNFMYVTGGGDSSGGGAADNLGNAIATTRLDMGNFAIVDSSGITVGTDAAKGLITISTSGDAGQTWMLSFSSNSETFFTVSPDSTVIRNPIIASSASFRVISLGGASLTTNGFSNIGGVSGASLGNISMIFSFGGRTQVRNSDTSGAVSSMDIGNSSIQNGPVTFSPGGAVTVRDAFLGDGALMVGGSSNTNGNTMLEVAGGQVRVSSDVVVFGSMSVYNIIQSSGFYTETTTTTLLTVTGSTINLRSYNLVFTSAPTAVGQKLGVLQINGSNVVIGGVGDDTGSGAAGGGGGGGGFWLRVLQGTHLQTTSMTFVGSQANSNVTNGTSYSTYTLGTSTLPYIMMPIPAQALRGRPGRFGASDFAGGVSIGTNPSTTPDGDNKMSLDYFAFAPSTGQFAYFQTSFSSGGTNGWLIGSTVSFNYSGFVSSGGAGGKQIQMGLQMGCIGGAESLTSTAYGTSVTLNLPNIGANMTLYKSTPSASITLGGAPCFGDDMIVGRIFRNPQDPSDNLGGATGNFFNLTGLNVWYRKSDMMQDDRMAR